jgi:methylated-DNA-[protein]-cysteine S-methyltransferase
MMRFINYLFCFDFIYNRSEGAYCKKLVKNALLVLNRDGSLGFQSILVSPWAISVFQSTDSVGWHLMIRHTMISSPLGNILLVADDRGLITINFQNGKGAKKPPRDSEESAMPFKDAASQLRAYFRGELKKFTIPLSPQGTAFQLGVWKELCRIPYGKTISYRELAQRVGRPTAWRAVGSANRCNPLPIVVPCHRVIGSNGQLTGYYGGTHLKEYLLKLESAEFSGRG